MAAMTASGGEPAPVANPGDAQLDTDVPQQPPPPPRRDIDRGQAQKAEPDAHPVDKSLPVPASGGQATSATASAVTETPPPGTLLVYTAHVTMAVYQVDSAIDAVEAIARGVGGYLAARGDVEIRVRVPRARFDEALHKVESSGDVIHRDIAAEDVTDAYVDTEARLKNARAVRDRLQALLEKASVKEAIDIQRELERVTAEIEVLEGKLASLQNRVAYSTIDVAFQPRGSVALHESPVHLPFPWLGELGLPKLLDLRGAR